MNNTESSQSNKDRTFPTRDHRRITGAKVARITGWVIVGVFVACLFALLFGLLVRWLWGVTLTPLFHLPQPSYWQAVGLIILCKLLFTGIGHPRKDSDHSFGHGKWHDRFEGHYERDHSDVNRMNSHENHMGYYRDFWEKEGKKAFEDYLDRRTSKS